MKIYHHFKPYRRIFNNLTMGVSVKTDAYVVVTITIVNKQNKAIVLCKEKDEVYHIEHYDLKLMEKIESVTGMIIYGDYIKANIID